VTGRPRHRALYAAIVQSEENAARHRLDRLAGGVNLIDLCERVIARRCAGSATIGLPGGYPIRLQPQLVDYGSRGDLLSRYGLPLHLLHQHGQRADARDSISLPCGP
jgi:hypothetical protein